MPSRTNSLREIFPDSTFSSAWFPSVLQVPQAEPLLQNHVPGREVKVMLCVTAEYRNPDKAMTDAQLAIALA